MKERNMAAFKADVALEKKLRESGEPVRVAVYGTLMRGERNEHWAREAGARVLGEGTVRGRLYDTGYGYPVLILASAVIDRGDDVAVEVLETDMRGLLHMDVLEGYPNLYGRDTVTVTLDDGGTADAIIYTPNCDGMAQKRILPNVSPTTTHTAGVADWREYRKAREVRA